MHVNKLFIALVFGAAVLFGFVGAATYELRALSETSLKVIEADAERRFSSLQFVAAINAATVAEKSILLEQSRDEQRKQGQVYRAAIDRALTAVNRLIAIADGPDRRTAGEQLKQGLLEYDGMVETIVHLSLQGEREAALTMSATEASRARTGLGTRAGDVARTNRDDFLHHRAEAIRSAGSARTALTAISIASALLCVASLALGALLMLRSAGEGLPASPPPQGRRPSGRHEAPAAAARPVARTARPGGATAALAAARVAPDRQPVLSARPSQMQGSAVVLATLFVVLAERTSYVEKAARAAAGYTAAAAAAAARLAALLGEIESQVADAGRRRAASTVVPPEAELAAAVIDLQARRQRDEVPGADALDRAA